jgi:hypothetical protein
MGKHPSLVLRSKNCEEKRFFYIGTRSMAKIEDCICKYIPLPTSFLLPMLAADGFEVANLGLAICSTKCATAARFYYLLILHKKLGFLIIVTSVGCT